MDGWDVALLVVAGYVAIMALVHLMIRRRDQMVEQFRKEMDKEKKRREAEERKRRFQREQAA
jgi:hypothetical protein